MYTTCSGVLHEKEAGRQENRKREGKGVTREWEGIRNKRMEK